MNSPHKGQWRGALMLSLICVWINGWVNNREAGDLRRYRAHYDVTVMLCAPVLNMLKISRQPWRPWRCLIWTEFTSVWILYVVNLKTVNWLSLTFVFDDFWHGFLGYHDDRPYVGVVHFVKSLQTCCSQTAREGGPSVVHLEKYHYNDFIMSATASLITSLTIVYSIVYIQLYIQLKYNLIPISL